MIFRRSLCSSTANSCRDRKVCAVFHVAFVEFFGCLSLFDLSIGEAMEFAGDVFDKLSLRSFERHNMFEALIRTISKRKVREWGPQLR